MGEKSPVYIFDMQDRLVQITPRTARQIDDMARKLISGKELTKRELDEMIDDSIKDMKQERSKEKVSKLDALLGRTYEEKDLIRWKELHDLFQKDYKALTRKEMRQMMFMPDNKTPRCQFCGHAMHNYVAKTGKFKGQFQHYSWVCDCPAFRRAGIVIGVG